MSGGFLPNNNKKKKRMSHFCPSLESEHCSKTGPSNTVLLPARQSGEEKWLNSHCNRPHPQPSTLQTLPHPGPGSWPVTVHLCRVCSYWGNKKKKRKAEWIKKKLKKMKLQSCPPASSCAAVMQQTLKQPSDSVAVVTVLS